MGYLEPTLVVCGETAELSGPSGRSVSGLDAVGLPREDRTTRNPKKNEAPTR